MISNDGNGHLFLPQTTFTEKCLLVTISISSSSVNDFIQSLLLFNNNNTFINHNYELNLSSSEGHASHFKNQCFRWSHIFRVQTLICLLQLWKGAPNQTNKPQPILPQIQHCKAKPIGPIGPAGGDTVTLRNTGTCPLYYPQNWQMG